MKQKNESYVMCNRVVSKLYSSIDICIYGGGGCQQIWNNPIIPLDVLSKPALTQRVRELG
jgi:hypothetical protein